MADKYEMKDMTGALFVNKKKESDKHPDRNGTVKIHGTEYRISGWLRKSKNGESYMSIAVNEMKENSGGYNKNQNNGGSLGGYGGGDDF